jgi:prepilin-type N-terminal cleavage/methylation domain-containing protein
VKAAARPRDGFTLIEALVGLVVGALVLAGGFRLWKANHEETWRLRKKTELRDRMTLSSKRIQRSITLAGLGMAKAPTLIKSDAVGSDTLVIFLNAGEQRSALLSDLYAGQLAVYVGSPQVFQGNPFLAVSDGDRGEVKPIERISGNVVILSRPLESAYSRAQATALPARRERYYTDQGGNRLLCDLDGATRVLGEDMRNFQVSFRDRQGASTEDPKAVRAVQFSYTGIFPAREGMLNSILFTSTAIPRNLL